jgi:hypothetical protein
MPIYVSVGLHPRVSLMSFLIQFFYNDIGATIWIGPHSHYHPVSCVLERAGILRLRPLVFEVVGDPKFVIHDIPQWGGFLYD